MNAEDEITKSRWDTQQVLPEGERNDPILEYLNLDEIVTNGGTQSRAALNQEVIASYAQKIQSGIKFPPIDVYYDGERYWLADGFHRVAAYQNLKTEFSWEETIAAKIHQGTRRDAVLHSVGANDNHGLRRSNADKHRAVMTLLQDAEWGGWSNCQIAKVCRVDEKTVRNLRKMIAPVTSDIRSDTAKSGSSTRTYKTKHGKIAQMQVDSIGEKRYPTNNLTIAENSSSVSSESERQDLRLQQDVNTVDCQAATALATVAPTHPLSGSTVAIAELTDREGAVVELPNGSREYILFKDLRLLSSLEVHQPHPFIPEETRYTSSPDSETSPPIENRSPKLIGQMVTDANLSLYQIICEISAALIACIEYLPSKLLQELVKAIETELGSRSASNQPIENSETIDN